MKKGRVLALVLAAICCGGCLSAPAAVEDEIRVVGSDTMLELDRRLAEEFMRSHPGDTVRVQGGGSGTGIDALRDGRATIAAASRPLSSEEVAALHEQFGTLGVRYLVAQDALSVYLHRDNSVRSLTLDQLRGIFDGSISRWSEVGGDPSTVVVVVRPPSSGTHRFFRDHVLGGAPYSPHAVTVPTTRGVLAAVQADPASIGYGGHAYSIDNVVRVAIDGVLPTPANVGQGRYPLARYLAFYTTRPATGLARRFIDWCQSGEGQRVVTEVGYIALWKGE